MDGMSGQVHGLDYAAVRAVMDMLDVPDTAQTFRDVRVMEAAALEVFNAAAR
jgi:hypothetical protein